MGSNSMIDSSLVLDDNMELAFENTVCCTRVLNFSIYISFFFLNQECNDIKETVRHPNYVCISYSPSSSAKYSQILVYD